MGSTYSKVLESSEEKGIMENGDARLVFSGTKANGLERVSGNHFREKTENSEVLMNNRPNIRMAVRPNIRRVPKAVQGEQIAAGWPSWLTAVAGEAINGWVPRRADTFEKIDKIGQGTYSDVYKARDITNGKIVALKKVRFDNLEPESVKFMAREILILRRLHHPNIIELEGLVTSRLSCSLYLVFEYMEHDLTGITSLPGVKFTEPQVKCYMHQLLTGLEYCHSRGVLHRDIKCSNLLLNNHGKLKITDFGLSSFFDGYQNFALTSRVVTLWYRPPELLLGQIHYGVAVDLWSTGCVLGELYAGKPIMPGRTEVEQLHKIFKLCGSPADEYWKKSKLPHATVFKPQQPYTARLAETFKDISPTAFSLLATLLSLDPEHRGTAASALQSEFFTTEPLACDPSSLPKYLPSQEAYARLQERKANSPRAPRYEFVQREPKKAQPHPSHDANQILQAAIEARREKERLGNMLKEHNHLKTDAAEQRLEKARADKAQVPMNETKSDPVYPWPSHVPSSYKAQLLKLDDHSQKGTEETRPGKKWDKLLDRVTAAQVYTGPEIVPSYNVDQLLEEHDRQIQESAQKLTHEKRRESKIQVQERPNKDHSIPYVPLPVSVSNVDDLLDEHDRQIQESTQRWRWEKKNAYKVNP